MNLSSGSVSRRYLSAAILITIAALGFRLFLALYLPNDAPDDGRLYAQIALNFLDHHSYSIETEEPFAPTYIRVPGYPLFLAGVYQVFGHNNNRAVRVVQAFLDSFCCWLTGFLAFAWMPESWSRRKRRRLMLLAVMLAGICPFTAIYVATILTETWAILLAVACLLTATLAMKTRHGPSLWWWLATGVLGGGLVLFRPDGALFVAACGATLVVVDVYRILSDWRTGSAKGESTKLAVRTLGRTVICGVVLSLGFLLALTPWTVRNARVFKVFQPIAPFDARMPGEFAPQGYITWLRTWTRDWRYIDPVEWSLDERHILITQFPDYAFDSAEEKARVDALLQRYNRVQPDAPVQVEKPKAQSDGDDSDDDADEADDQEAGEQKADVKMTPELDGEFAALARERINRQPLRYYLGLPARRASSLWFDTHSQYFPFEGELFPLAKLDRDRSQQYWLPVFILVLWIYTILGIVGVWRLLKSRQAGRWVLLLALVLIPRLIFLSSLENPEPRYVVELFPFLAVAGCMAFEKLIDRLTGIPDH